MLDIIRANVAAVQGALVGLLEELDGYEKVATVEGSAAAGALGQQLATICRHRQRLRKTAKKKPPPQPEPQHLRIAPPPPAG